MRIPSRAQKGILRCVDVVTYVKGVFYIIQCKYKKRYLHREEIQRIKVAATQFMAEPLLCYRDRGLKFEVIN